MAAGGGEADWEEMQKKAFMKWISQKIKGKHEPITDLSQLKDGIAIIALLESETGKSVGRYQKPCKGQFQEMANLNLAFDFMKKEGLNLTGVGAEDIHRGNQKLILGLMWTMIVKYQIAKSAGDGSEGKQGGRKVASNVRKDMLEWVNSRLAGYNVPPVTDFVHSFKDGRALSALVDSLGPGAVDMTRLGDPMADLSNAISIADARYRIPALLDASDFINNSGDELSVMMYLSYYRQEATRQEMLWKQQQQQNQWAAQQEADRKSVV